MVNRYHRRNDLHRLDMGLANKAVRPSTHPENQSKQHHQLITPPRYHIAMTLYGFAPFIWMSKTGRAEPLLHSFFTSLRANEGSQLPLGVAGFCWGGKHAIDLTHAPKDGSKPLVDTCFVAHPSNLILPVDIEKVSRPLSVAIGDKDFVLREAGRKQVKGILKERENVRSEFVLYPGAGHGFSIRADPKNEKQAEQAAEAEDQAINWFNSMS